MVKYDIDLGPKEIEVLGSQFNNPPYRANVGPDGYTVVAVEIKAEPVSFMAYDQAQMTLFHGVIREFPLYIKGDIKARMGTVHSLESVVRGI